MSEDPRYGSFELVSKIKGHEAPDIHEPKGRFVSVRDGRNLVVVDTRPKKPKPTGLVFKEATSTTRLSALHPTGKRVAVRSQFEHWLELRSADGVEARIEPNLQVLDAGGKVLDARQMPDRFADEHLAFTHDGKGLVLVGARDGAARVQLYDAKSLKLLDELEGLVSHSPYNRGGAEPLPLLSESELRTSPAWAGGFVLFANAGDSANAVVTFEVERRKLVLHDQAIVQASVFDVDSAFLRGMTHTGEDLVSIGRDHSIGLHGWPARLKARKVEYAANHLEAELGEGATFGDGRLALPIENWPLGTPHPIPLGVAYFSADTLAYLGRADLPKIRGRVKQARAWGVDLVAVETASQVHVFRRKD